MLEASTGGGALARGPSDSAPSPSRAAAYSPVRMATMADEEAIIAMLRLMHKEAGMRDYNNEPFPLCEEKMRASVQRAIIPRRNDPSAIQLCCGVIGTSSQIEASICLGVASDWYSDTQYIGDMWNYVSPQFRRHTRHARTLIAFAKTLADTLHMSLRLANVGVERIEAKDRFLARELGAKPIGQHFVYHPQPLRAF